MLCRKLLRLVRCLGVLRLAQIKLVERLPLILCVLAGVYSGGIVVRVVGLVFARREMKPCALVRLAAGLAAGQQLARLPANGLRPHVSLLQVFDFGLQLLDVLLFFVEGLIELGLLEDDHGIFLLDGGVLGLEFLHFDCQLVELLLMLQVLLRHLEARLLIRLAKVVLKILHLLQHLLFLGQLFLQPRILLHQLLHARLQIAVLPQEKGGVAALPRLVCLAHCNLALARRLQLRLLIGLLLPEGPSLRGWNGPLLAALILIRGIGQLTGRGLCQLLVLLRQVWRVKGQLRVLALVDGLHGVELGCLRNACNVVKGLVADDGLPARLLRPRRGLREARLWVILQMARAGHIRAGDRVENIVQVHLRVALKVP